MYSEKIQMNNKLLKKIRIRFWSANIIFSLSIILVLVLIIIEINSNSKSKENSILIGTYVVVLITLIVISIIDNKPYFKDLKYLKNHSDKTFIGKVTKYRKVIHSGDPDTVSYYPTFTDVNRDWIEIELKVKNTELNKKYQCLYLPNTKLAVCEEIKNTKKVN